jgi:trk system potassium uptake protein TrkH
VVLFVAVLPTLGVGGKKLYRVEAPGPAPEGVRPHIRETARILWFIYLGLTLVEVAALWALTPMDLFESICHTFATMATGGFSTSSASVGDWDTGVAPWIVIIFMVLAGGNFGLYYQAMRGRLSQVWADPEFRLYLILLGGGAVLVTMSIWGQTLTSTAGDPLEPAPVTTVREALFTTVSIQTTTGFCTTDFDLWPFLAKAVLIALMFVGGCAGSTAGGIKVIRIWIAMKIMVAEIEKAFRPNVVRPLKVAGGSIEPEQRLGVLAYIVGIIFLFAVGSLALMLLESHHPDMTYTTAATASVATLCTIGPGLEGVGAVQNYGWFTDPSKILMCVLMALGRLEVLAIIVMFSPSFWRK